MKKMLHLVLSLTAISAVCAAVLAYVNNTTRDAIAQIQVQQTLDAARAVMPGAVEKVDPLGENGGAFVGRNAAGDVVGYAVRGSDPNGYGGEVALMVGFEADKTTLVCYRKLAAAETPGLGMNLTLPDFADQFKGKNASRELRVKKDGGEIEAITSATITSRAVCGAVNAAAKTLAALAP